MVQKQSIACSCFTLNLLVFIGLLYLCYIMKPTKEGISNMNCCGGIEPGVHYSETDRKPPPYVRRCFQSNDLNGETVYEWNGFPCTNSEDSDCCNDGNRKGQCRATSKGGYCKSNDGNFTFVRKEGSKTRPYIKRSKDDILDINDARDMEDYFYSRRDDSKSKSLSPEMKRFMARRDKNERFVEDAIVSKNASREKTKLDLKNKRDDKTKNYQIISIITIIHLLVLVIIAIVIRRTIIAKIQGYLDVLNVQYLKFSGKSL